MFTQYIYTNINTSHNISHSLHDHKINNVDLSEPDIDIFTIFVENIIKSDSSHQDYIHSCLRGSYNNNLLFFKTGRNYRYCPKRNGQHQHNTTAIMINTKNCTYTIRCKDVDCNNNILAWKKKFNKFSSFIKFLHCLLIIIRNFIDVEIISL